MGFLDTIARIPKILEANVNSLLDKCEDPVKMIDQLLVDYKRNLGDVKKDLAEVMANLNMAEKELKEQEEKVAKYANAAQAAVNAGNLDDARQLLASKQAAEATRDSLKQNYDVCLQNCNTMKAGYNKLVQDIEVLEQKRDTAKAKMSMAKAQEKINSATSIAKASKVSDSFAKYEEKADKALARANAMLELDSNIETADQLANKYNIGGSSPSVEAELQAMMAKANGGVSTASVEDELQSMLDNKN